MTELSGQGRAILGELVKHMKTRKVISGDPRTYTFYQTVHDDLRLEMRGDGLPNW